MFMVSKVLRIVIAGCLVAALGACSSDDADPEPDDTGPAITFNMMRAALLQPQDVGPVWELSDHTPSLTALVDLCGGGATRLPAPGKPTMTSVVLIDEGEKGAQSFDQIGLVYPDAATARSALATLRAAADACPPSVTKAAEVTPEKKEPAYTETVTTTDLKKDAWSGFAAVRHKQYPVDNPGSIDSAVSVLRLRNVVLVASYGVYWLGAHSTGPEFNTNWQRLVASILSGIDP